MRNNNIFGNYYVSIHFHKVLAKFNACKILLPYGISHLFFYSSRYSLVISYQNGKLFVFNSNVINKTKPNADPQVQRRCMPQQPTKKKRQIIVYKTIKELYCTISGNKNTRLTNIIKLIGYHLLTISKSSLSSMNEIS